MHNHAPDDYVCPFCLIAQGAENDGVVSRRDNIVYRNETVTAFIGSGQWPNNPGNIIVIPNEHFENIYDLPVHFAAKIHEAAQAIAIAMKTAFACDGVSTRQHNEPAGNTGSLALPSARHAAFHGRQLLQHASPGHACF